MEILSVDSNPTQDGNYDDPNRSHNMSPTAVTSMPTSDTATPLVIRASTLTCPISTCGKAFIGLGTKAAYTRHVNAHKRPFTCPDIDCERHTKGFSRKDNLKTHREKKHPKTNNSKRRASGKERENNSANRKSDRVDAKRLERSMKRKFLKVMQKSMNKAVNAMLRDLKEDEDDDDDMSEDSTDEDEDGDE
ncbi:hypothetical protein FPQ18DRAFT_334096 [Pyronema domesticum]|uniref:C2H2-type domain-containing protein n=1 Tax=Pyronema omphalodes (strain CBS 100304) TaxID=1076935 RepID=U4L753_PYROM|nr:hypothetical protein FPQ18DRAFT_334096 [Pyronema domesticum]CCX05865.1 Similar to hypothetical protein FOXB_01964 [Fusarium oxysporum Fo5176]; acc. no. EGU87516 [Pyronema omphalodes CBS 100304]